MGPILTLLLGGLASAFSGGKKKETSTTDSKTDASINKSGVSASSARTLNEESEDALTSGLTGLLNPSGGIGTTVGALQDVQSKIKNQPIEFDRDSYVQGVTGAAKQKLDLELESDINELFAGIGSSAGGNSSVALLKNKLDRQNAVDVAGITSEAEKTGVQLQSGIRADEVNQQTSIAGEFTKILESLIGGVKGASITEASATKEAGTQASTTKGTTKGTATEGGFDGGNIADIFKSLTGVKY